MVLIGLQSLKGGIRHRNPSKAWSPRGPAALRASVLPGQEANQRLGCVWTAPSMVIGSKAQPFRMNWSLKVLPVKEFLPLCGCGESTPETPFSPFNLDLWGGPCLPRRPVPEDPPEPHRQPLQRRILIFFLDLWFLSVIFPQNGLGSRAPAYQLGDLGKIALPLNPVSSCKTKGRMYDLKERYMISNFPVHLPRPL